MKRKASTLLAREPGPDGARFSCRDCRYENDRGGTETNREALVQIELIGFSKFEKWSPPNAVMKVLADLMRQLHEIPLQRAGDETRSRALWDGRAGWFGHLEVPENDHTDPRAFDWPKLFPMAAKTAERWEIVSGDQLLFHTPTKSSDGETGLDRVAAWIKNHEERVQKEERENGRISVRRVPCRHRPQQRVLS